MKLLEVPGFPYKIGVIWFANVVEVYLVGEDGEYMIRIWHTTARKVMVKRREWRTLVEEEFEGGK